MASVPLLLPVHGCIVHGRRPSVGGSAFPVATRYQLLSITRRKSSSRGASGPRQTPKLPPLAATMKDRTIEIKIAIARGTDKLDLSELDEPLAEIPEAVFDLTDLKELSLAGNHLTRIPPEIARLSNLEKLQISGNSLEELPPEIGDLEKLEGLWVHGNLLRSLPDSLCRLTGLKVLSLAGNCISELPSNIGNLEEVEDLGLPGNRLVELPPSIGKLRRLRKLSLHGNSIASLPSSIGDLTSLQELWLMGNDLTELPASMGGLPALKQLSVADNVLSCVPECISLLPSLSSLWLYGNSIATLPRGLGCMASLVHLWLEGNPLTADAVDQLLAEVSQAGKLKSVGLDDQQARQASGDLVDGLVARGVLEVARIAGLDELGTLEEAGKPRHRLYRGYFKLKFGTQFHKDGSPKVLVVAFGSAPGVPNWAGLLKRISAEAEQAVAGRFDILYVVDTCRSWYGGGDNDACAIYTRRLEASIKGYDEVVMVGDSMGATAVLLFSTLATRGHAFCPQVDLQEASIRPGKPSEWLSSLKSNLLKAVKATDAEIMVHSGNWQHDLDQAVIVEHSTDLRVYDVNSHRLALYLDSQGRLMSILKDTIFEAMRDKPSLRLNNLL